MSDVVLGFVGCGFMGQTAHIANYASIPGVRLKGLTDLKTEQARRVAARYGIEQVYPSVDALAQDPEIQGVICTLGWDQNVRVAVRCLNAGKHVVTEKPLAGRREDAEAIVQAAQASKRHACVGYMKCFDSGVEWARTQAEAWARPPDLVRVHFGGGDWVNNAGAVIRTDEQPETGEAGHRSPPEFSKEEGERFRFYANQHVHHLGLLRFLLGRELTLHDVVRKGRSHIALFHAGETLVSLEYAPLAAEWWEESTRLHWGDGYIEIRTPPPLLRNVPAHVRMYRHREAAPNGKRPLGRAQLGGDFIEPSLPADWAFRRAAEHFVRVVGGEEEPRVPAEHGLRDVIHCAEMATQTRTLSD